MNIRHLRYFVTIAETLHFGRAAQQLHMSQPPLSKRIAELEDALGQTLFDRRSRTVRLTRAGSDLLPKAKAAVDAFDAVLDFATAPKSSPALRIGFPPDTSQKVLADFVALCGTLGVETMISEATTAEQSELLANGDLDIGVLRHPFDQGGLRVASVLRQDLGVIMPKTHPLSRCADISLDALDNCPLVIFPRSMAPGLHDALVESCRKDGFNPARIYHAGRMTPALLLAQSAVALGPEPTPHSPCLIGEHPDLAWKPVRGRRLHWSTSVVVRRCVQTSFAERLISRIESSLMERDSWKMLRSDRIGHGLGEGCKLGAARSALGESAPLARAPGAVR